MGVLMIMSRRDFESRCVNDRFSEYHSYSDADGLRWLDRHPQLVPLRRPRGRRRRRARRLDPPLPLPRAPGHARAHPGAGGLRRRRGLRVHRVVAPLPGRRAPAPKSRGGTAVAPSPGWEKTRGVPLASGSRASHAPSGQPPPHASRALPRRQAAVAEHQPHPSAARQAVELACEVQSDGWSSGVRDW